MEEALLPESGEKYEYKWKVISVFRTPEERLQVDVDTALEYFFSGLTIIGIIAFVICLILCFTNQGMIKAESLVFWMIGIVSVTGISAFLRKNTNNYLIIDAVQRRIFYRFRFFSVENMSVIVHFNDILAISIDCKRERVKGGTMVYYAPVIVTRQGKKILLSKWDNNQLFPLNEDGRELARLIAVDFVEGQENKKIDVRPTVMDPIITFRPPNFLEEMGPVNWFVFGAMFLFFLYMMYLTNFHR